jgi:xylulokinase
VGHLLGIDLGTSACKAILMAEDGRVLGVGSADYPLLQPAPTWAEQQPEAWWRGVGIAVRSALAAAGCRGEDVAAVGLTGQMHGAVLLDARDQVLRPALLWCDQRSAPQAEALGRRLGQERIIALCANPALPNFTLTKLLWVREHESDLLARVRRVLLPKDYIRLRLTGVAATDVSDASGTLAFDVAGRRWSREMCELAEIPAEWWPPASESTAVTARVSPAGAEATGLAPGTPVVGGAGDQAAGAVGNGIVAPGLVSVTVGTSGVVFAATEGVLRDPRGRLHTFCHAVPGAWHVMGVTQAAGGSLQWWRNAFCQAEVAVAAATGEDPYDVICREAARAPAGCEGLVFLPYLMGERTPHTDPLARGVFFGITPRHGRAAFARAILEGVAQSLRDCLQLIEDLGCPVREIRMAGGGARSALWRQIHADVFARPLRAMRAQEGPALGAAILAAVGAGAYASVEEACGAIVRPGEEVRPQPDGVAAYIEQGEVYRALYAHLQPLFAAAGVGGGPGTA